MAGTRRARLRPRGDEEAQALRCFPFQGEWEAALADYERELARMYSSTSRAELLSNKDSSRSVLSGVSPSTEPQPRTPRTHAPITGHDRSVIDG